MFFVQLISRHISHRHTSKNVTAKAAYRFAAIAQQIVNLSNFLSRVVTHLAVSYKLQFCIFEVKFIHYIDGMSKVATTKHNVEAGGIYTAVTKNEFLVVDGIVASPFALAHGIAHSFFDRADVSEWCKDNSHLVEHTADEEIKDIAGSNSRRLNEGVLDKNNDCVELIETLFENYKDEGVGWGTNGWGYKTFKTEETSLAMRLSGFISEHD